MAPACRERTLWQQVLTCHRSVASGDYLSILRFFSLLLSLPLKQYLPLFFGWFRVVAVHLESRFQRRFCIRL
jgi:hypothetical protein